MNTDFALVLDSLGWALLHSLWQGCLAALAVIIFRALTRDNQATLRYSFQLLMLLTCLAAFAATFAAYHLKHALPIAAAEGGASFASITSIFGDKGLAGPAITRGNFAATLTPLTPALGLLWCLGFAALALRYVGAFAITQSLRRRGISTVPADWNRRFNTLVLNSGIRRRVEIFISNKVTSPMTLGFFKPIVLVPASFFTGLPSEQVEAILLHEIAHIRRHDYLINLFQTVIRTVFFFHPAIYFISRLIDNDRENACDDFAVALTNNPKALARGLVALRLGSPKSRFALAAHDGNTPLMARLNRLGYGKTSRRRPEHVLVSVGTLALTAALIPVTSPLADAKPMPSTQMKLNTGHPSAKLGNYTFEKIRKNNRDFTVKVAADGSRWINVDGAWHDIDDCPEMIEKLPAIPAPPVPLAGKDSRHKQNQFDIDEAYYNARIALETVTSAKLDTSYPAAPAPQYDTAALETHMANLRQRRESTFLQSHKSREFAQEALTQMKSDVDGFVRGKLTAAPHHSESVASWDADTPSGSIEDLAGAPSRPSGVYLDGEHVDLPDASEWMGEFEQEMANVEARQRRLEISHKEADKARRKAERLLEKRIETAHAAYERAQDAKERALDQAERQRERAQEQAERKQERAQAARERAQEARERATERARERQHASHNHSYQSFNRDMLKQLKKDGLIRSNANDVTLTYPHKRMTVNGVSVPHDVANNYCNILERHNIRKRHNARIDIAPGSFHYSSRSGDFSHVIEENFNIAKKASLELPGAKPHTVWAKPVTLQYAALPASPARPQWTHKEAFKPQISYNFHGKINISATPPVTPQLIWSSSEREMSVGQRNAHLSPN